MLDNLKDHIEENRDNFELYPFDSDNGWAEIAPKVTPREKKDPWRLVGIAACFALIISGSLFVMNSKNQPTDEISELENYYTSEINQKISLVKNQIGDDRILDDLTLMDQAFTELKADLNDNVDNQEVITAMMENYQLKLQILEEILNELEKEKSEEIL